MNEGLLGNVCSWEEAGDFVSSNPAGDETASVAKRSLPDKIQYNSYTRTCTAAPVLI